MAAVMARGLLRENTEFWYKITHTNMRTTSLHQECSIFKRTIYHLSSFPSRSDNFSDIYGNGRILKLRNCINIAEVDNLKQLSGCIQLNATFVNRTSARFYSSANRNVTSGHEIKLDNNGSDVASSPSKTASDIFDNNQIAYGKKSLLELLRTLGFFFLCRFSFFTDNAVKIMGLCYRILGPRVAEAVIKKAAYDQFVAGETPNDVQRVASQLRQGGVASILCVPIETDDQASTGISKEIYLDANLDKVLASINLCTQLGDPLAMTQFRISALIAGDLTLPGWANFPQERTEELQKGLRRLGKIRLALENRDVIVLIDAEYTKINPALRLLSLCLMKVCNTGYAKIFYTYQTYLKATRACLQQDLAFAASSDFGFGVKLVRGAYMVVERQLARELGYPDPVNETFELTTASYHSCLDLLLEHVAAQRSSSVRVLIASHNEDTVRYAMDRMNQLHVPKDSPDVFFGQLYGMADHVSFTLGNHGYRVYKSIPYGPVQETLPYLARRAQENKAILANARKERQLVAKALLNRLRFKN